MLGFNQSLANNLTLADYLHVLPYMKERVFSRWYCDLMVDIVGAATSQRLLLLQPHTLSTSSLSLTAHAHTQPRKNTTL
jgi:hypothetical protein